jgi:hypothetical protein
MNQSSAGPELTKLGRSGLLPEELGYCAWIAFWAELVGLAVLAVLGAFFASADDAPGDYACGLLLSLAAIALAAMRVKSRFDSAAADWASFLLVDDMANLLAVIVIFTILGLAGLFAASGFDRGGLHDGGVALFAASGLGVFLSMKHVFDRRDRTR